MGGAKSEGKRHDKSSGSYGWSGCLTQGLNLIPGSNLISSFRNLLLIEGVVSKETVVLRRWGSSIQKFGFINGVDNVNWPPYRDSKRISVRWPIYIINSVDKTKFLYTSVDWYCKQLLLFLNLSHCSIV